MRKLATLVLLLASTLSFGQVRFEERDSSLHLEGRLGHYEYIGGDSFNFYDDKGLVFKGHVNTKDRLYAVTTPEGKPFMYAAYVDNLKEIWIYDTAFNLRAKANIYLDRNRAMNIDITESVDGITFTFKSSDYMQGNDLKFGYGVVSVLLIYAAELWG